jgi:uncharacterized membrane protein YgcG
MAREFQCDPVRRWTSEVTVRKLLTVLGALLFLVLGVGPAAAAPVALTAPLTDETGVLAPADRTAIRDVIDQVAERSGVGLRVVFVSSFDSLTADSWAAQTAEKSHLDGTDVLVAVAVDDDSYEYTWWMGDDSPIDENDVSALFSDDVEPLFDSDDWVGGIRAAGDGLETASADVAAERAEEQRTQWSPTTVLLIIGSVAVVLLAAHLLSRRKRSAGAALG